MTRLLLNHELKRLCRDRRLGLLVAIVSGLLFLTIWIGHETTQGQEKARRDAVEHNRAQWEEMGEMNPHSAAHFGSYAFKPIDGLAALDPGIDSFVGNVLRLEGHVQNEPGFSEASFSGSMVKFGRLQAAMVLQLLIPLLLLFGAYESVTGERESGRLRLLLVQGASPIRLLMAKAFTWWLLSLVILFSVFALTVALSNEGVSSIKADRAALLAVVYAVWFAIVVLGATLVSGFARDGRGALVTLLLVWLVWSVILPRLTGELADRVHPLPTRATFETAKTEDRLKGLNGHNPQDQRRRELEESTLTEYGVERLEDLPINFDGVLMQADEEYGNAVWDKHFGEVRDIFARQLDVVRAVSILNPYLALRELSASLAGTDLVHALAFQVQAEQYRRELVARLNHEHAYGGSSYADWSWTADEDFYREIKDFRYKPLKLASVLMEGRSAAMVLLGWLLALLVLTVTLGRRLRAV